jgi:hypothetical protein
MHLQFYTRRMWVRFTWVAIHSFDHVIFVHDCGSKNKGNVALGGWDSSIKSGTFYFFPSNTIVRNHHLSERLSPSQNPVFSPRWSLPITTWTRRWNTDLRYYWSNYWVPRASKIELNRLLSTWGQLRISILHLWQAPGHIKIQRFHDH